MCLLFIQKWRSNWSPILSQLLSAPFLSPFVCTNGSLPKIHCDLLSCQMGLSIAKTMWNHTCCFRECSYCLQCALIWIGDGHHHHSSIFLKRNPVWSMSRITAICQFDVTCLGSYTCCFIYVVLQVL